MDVFDGDSSSQAARSLDVCRADGGRTGKGDPNKYLQCIVCLLWVTWSCINDWTHVKCVRMCDRGRQETESDSSGAQTRIEDPCAASTYTGH